MAEAAFIQTFLSTISTQPVLFPDDYKQPPHNSLKRIPVLPIPVSSPPPPPTKKTKTQTTSQAESTLGLTFKSIKPSLSVTLSCSLSDTIASIKQQLADSKAGIPVEYQRLLVKGKALADNKLLKDYEDLIPENNTLNLVVKPGWKENMQTGKLDPSPPVPAEGKRRHGRIPSVVLSPSPSEEPIPLGVSPPPTDIVLNLDAIEQVNTGDRSSPVREKESTYHLVLKDPDFWRKLNEFLETQFPISADAVQAFEDFLRSAKQSLTANEIAKIRDVVGITGMAGR